jgi:large subunit ribosomal protein L18
MGKERNNRILRHKRVRSKIVGHPTRPRLAVFRSAGHIYAQLIDDSQGHTLVAASSLEDKKPSASSITKTETSKLVGALIAQKAKKIGVTKVVLDRGGYKYHGRVKALADAAREEGLVF